MIEYDQWLYVRTDSAEMARKFFGVPADWPCEFDGFATRKPGRNWRVLSPQYVRQQNDKRNANR